MDRRAARGVLSMREDELVAASRDRDPHAFAALLDRHRRVMEAAVATVGVPAADRMDALQEARLAAWRGLPSFRGESAVSSWLYRVTKNAAIGVGRRSARHRSNEDLDGDAMDIRSHDRPDESHPELDAVWRAIAELGEDEREVLVLFAFAGLSHEEIAAALLIAPGTSKARLSRARSRLAVAVGGVER